MDLDNSRDSDSDLDCFEVDSIVEEVEAIEGNDTASTKHLLKMMIEVIIKQHDEIESLTSTLCLLKDVLQINLNPPSIATCHPLNQNLNAPIIVEFIHQDRDLVWRRRTC